MIVIVAGKKKKVKQEGNSCKDIYIN